MCNTTIVLANGKVYSSDIYVQITNVIGEVNFDEIKPLSLHSMPESAKIATVIRKAMDYVVTVWDEDAEIHDKGDDLSIIFDFRDHRGFLHVDARFDVPYIVVGYRQMIFSYPVQAGTFDVTNTLNRINDLMPKTTRPEKVSQNGS